MTTPKRTSKLVKAIGGQDGGVDFPLQLRTGVVQAISKATTPWTLTITLGNTNISGITYLGWWDAVVGGIVQVLQQGPQLLVLGPLAPAKVIVSPHRHAAADVDGTIIVAPPAPPVPTAPPAVVTTRIVNITAQGSASWQFSYSTWRNDFIQGGSSSNLRRAFWFYGGQIAAAKGAGNIIGGSIFVRRTGTGGVYQGANVRLGTHGLGSASGSGAGAHGNVAVVGQLNKEQGVTFALTGAHLAALNAGAAGLGLEPGSTSYTSPDYLVGYGRDAGEWSGQLSLTIQG